MKSIERNNKLLITIILCFGAIIQIMAQDYYDTICWVRVNDPQYYAADGVMLSRKADLNSLFAQNGVQYYEKAYPFSKTPELLKIHEIRCETGKDINNVICSLQEKFTGVFDNFLYIDIPDEDVMTYDPVDWMWRHHAEDWLWHLKRIQADLAWDITTGDTCVKTAVIDLSIDVNHPDLSSEIYPPYDPYTETALPTIHNHGTAVASFVSAETTKQGETPLGELASVGFDSKIIAYETGSRTTFLQKALHSSTVMGADVIVSCAGGSLNCNPLPESGEELVMKEILNNGTVIVMPAGNGQNTNFPCETETYPFNSSYDERVIVVTSTDSADYHRHIENGEDKTHNHFPTVDICAPGYKVFGAQHTHLANNSTFPYYGKLTGTSFAAPIVAGACSLLKSINRDFTPGEIQYFIKSTADPVVDENDFHGLLGAGRLNVYRAVQMAYNCTPGVITSNILWNNDTIIVCGVEIMQGACLTINSNVLLSKHSPIIIHPGGKLIVDGGLLTSIEETMWPGIEVWGDTTTHQYVVNGMCGQGRLELRNGAIIENAVCAVELWRPGDTATTGGIIRADSALFRNNAKAVHALHFKNHKPTGVESNYISNFTNCAFVIDSGYFGTETFHQHVDFDDINGIWFKGCDFSVNRSTPGVSSSCSAITAYDAGFQVMSYCSDNNFTSPNPCPEEYVKHCSFTGFNDAIHSVSDGASDRAFSVQDALFQNNIRGIFAQNTGYATILRNVFLIGSTIRCSYGIYVDDISGFCIEENSFVSGVGRNEKIGIGVFNCGDSNDIYRNTFENIKCGNLAMGQNMNAIGDFAPETITAGLTYTCNQNSGNTIDFCILKDNDIGGVYPNQGSSIKPAGNTFDGNVYHIYNESDYQVHYWYYSGDPEQIPSSTLLCGVRTHNTNIENLCLTHYGSVIKSPNEKGSLIKLYQSSSDWHERKLAAGDIVRSDLHDTVANPEELRTWLANMNEIGADRTAIASYIQEGDFDNAFKLAETLPDRYQLAGEGMVDHTGYMQLLSLHRTLHNTHRTVAQLSDYERKMVEDIAENGKGYSKSLATVMLGDRFNDPYTDYTCPTLPTGSKGINGATGVNQKDTSGFSIAVIPNPASSQARVDYTLPVGCQQATFDIINALGVKVMSVTLEGESGSKAIMLDKIPEGVYSYSVFCGNNTITGKLIIVR